MLKKKIIIAAVFLVIALVTMFGISRFATSTKNYKKTIEYLDKNKKIVVELMTASTAASAAITIMPGDIATPIAEKLADVSSYFIIVLCAIYLEKFLLTIIGFISFVILLPAGFISLGANVFLEKDILRELAIKFIVIGLMIALVIPVSVKIGSVINDTYGSSIDEILSDAKKSMKDLEKEADEAKENEDEEEDKGWINNIIDSAKNGISTTTDKMELVLNNLLEALAVMIVTSCIIPILVILFFVGLIKSIFKIESDKNIFSLKKKDSIE